MGGDDDLASGRDLVLAELAAAAATARRRDRLASWLVWATAGAVVLGLLLPWSYNDGHTRNGFARSGAIAALGLLVAAAASVGATVHRVTGAAAALVAARLAAWAGTLFGIITTIGVCTGEQHSAPLGEGEVAHSGPWVFALAVIATSSATHLLGRDVPHRDTELVRRDDRFAGVAELRGSLVARLRPTPSSVLAAGAAGFGASGLALAAAALLAPWQRLHSTAIGELFDGLGDTLTWTAFDLESTRALRWTLLVTAVLVTATVWTRKTRRVVLPLVLVAGGVASAVASLGGLGFDSVDGINATLVRGPGPVLAFAGGLAAALGGAVALLTVARPGTIRRIAPALAAVVLGCGLLGAPVPPQARAADSDIAAHAVFGAGRSRSFETGFDGGPAQLGGSARDVFATDATGRSTSGPPAPQRPAAVSTRDGLFFLSPADGDTVLLLQVVHGRALPVTLLRTDDRVGLLGVEGGRALVWAQGDDSERAFAVFSLDLHASEHTLLLSAAPSSTAGRPTALVLHSRLGYSPPGLPVSDTGTLAAHDVDVTRSADGDVLITTDNRPQASYRVPAATVRSGQPWRAQPAPYATVAGRDGAGWRLASGEIDGVSAAGAARPVVGGVSDERCTLSRDPLSSYLGGVPGLYRNARSNALTVDGAGDVYLAVATTYRGTFRFLVRTPDGVLRSLPGQFARAVRSVQAQPDGSLLVQTYRGETAGATYRIASSAAFARSSPPLPAVASGCVSDNRVRVPSQQRPVTQVSLTRLPTPDPDDDSLAPVLIDASGTRLVASGGNVPDRIRRYPAHGRSRQVRDAGDAWTIEQLQADGRGGAWWDERAQDEFRLVHLAASGTVRVVRTLTRTDPQAQLDTAADSGDGSLWFRLEGERWTRITPGGATRRLGYTGAAPVVRDGRGFVTSIGSGTAAAYAVSGRAGSTRVLGGGSATLAIPSAVAGRVARAGVQVADSSVLVAPGGALLLYQGRYLARIGRTGPVVVLTGAAQGLPFVEGGNGVTAVVLGRTFVVYDGADTIWKVDLS